MRPASDEFADVAGEIEVQRDFIHTISFVPLVGFVLNFTKILSVEHFWPPKCL